MPAVPGRPDRRPRILVTGFGPWGPNTLNPSYQIASLLSSAPSPASSSTSPFLDSNPNIIIHPTPIPVSYDTVRSLVPALLETHQPDLVLHIGLAGGYGWFGLEKSAPRAGFRSGDVDGRVISPEDVDAMWPPDEFGSATGAGTEAAAGTGIEAGTGTEGGTGTGTASGSGSEIRSGSGSLVTETPYDEILDLWTAKCTDTVPEVAVRASDSVGAYLCGFIYHTSLRWFKRHGRRGNVLFLHVPPCPTEVALQQGTEVVKALLGAMEETWIPDGQC